MTYREKHALTDTALEPAEWQRECLRVRELTKDVPDAILDEALCIVYGPVR